MAAATKEKKDKPAPPAAGQPGAPRLQQKYHAEITPALAKKFGRENRLSLPKLVKISLNMGVGKATQDKALLDVAADSLGKISGQKQRYCKSCGGSLGNIGPRKPSRAVVSKKKA